MIKINSLELIIEGSDTVQTITIPPTIINNIEIINKDNLYVLITDWCKQRTFVSTDIIWILSPEICFEHTLTSTEQGMLDSETLQFLDTVPFEEVSSRTYNPIDGKRIIAVNKALITSFIQAFSLHGYSTRAAVPAFLIQADSILTKAVASAAIKHVGELAKESLVAASTSTSTPAPITVNTSTPKPKSSLPLLLGVFGVLLAILGFVIYLNK